MDYAKIELPGPPAPIPWKPYAVFCPWGVEFHVWTGETIACPWPRLYSLGTTRENDND